jgi:hypothetical protein
LYNQDRKQRQNGQNMTARTGQLRQHHRDEITTAVERGHMEQDIQLRQGNRDGTTVPVERGCLRHDIWGRTTLVQDSWDFRKMSNP